MRRFIGVVAILLLLSPGLLTASEPRPPFPDGNDVREIRAAIICYGGVSLAIYMYGNVRELHHLAAASAALECDANRSDGVRCAGLPDGVSAWDTLRDESAREYYKALVDLWRRDGVRPRFVIDVISGTSAGGINGVFLAKALTHNGPVENLREIWFREADIKRLSGRPFPYSRAVGRLLFFNSAALGGNRWLKQLYLALDGMDAPHDSDHPRLNTLLLAEQPLDLLVTTTDFYGSSRLLEIGDPATSAELRYDHVYRFSAERDGSGRMTRDDFGQPTDNVALAFAARSSASFPVAFPAIRLADLPEALGKDVPVNPSELAGRLFADRLAEKTMSEAQLAEKLFLVDGGVLDNRPFGIAHRRVSGRSPRRETDRIYLYLEPDPQPLRIPDPRNPNAIEMFWQAKTTIPAAQPLAGDLIDIAEHNRSVARIAEIIRNDDLKAKRELVTRGIPEDGSVASRVESALHLPEDALADPAPLRDAIVGSDVIRKERDRIELGTGASGAMAAGLSEIRALRTVVERDAANEGSLVEDSYQRLRVESVLDQFARVMTSDPRLCGFPAEYEGPRASLMRAIVHQWAEGQMLTGSGADPAAREEFLAAFDLGYLRRRLRFVNDWLNLQYPKGSDVKLGLTREQVERAQGSIGNGVDALTACLRGGCLGGVPPNVVADAKSAMCNFDANQSPAQQAEAILGDPAKIAAITALSSALREVTLTRQDALLAQLYKDFLEQTADWKTPDGKPNREAVRAVLGRYVGFAYWDRASYPYTAFSDIGDMSHIAIKRMSPNDAKLAASAAKLKGAGLGHFGAFFSADGRQRDYIWGRLDGADRLLRSVLNLTEDERRARLFQAIINDEKRDAKVSGKNLRYMEWCISEDPRCALKALKAAN